MTTTEGINTTPEPQVPAGQILQPQEGVAAGADTATERTPIDQVLAVAARAKATAIEAATQAREAVSVQKVDLPFGLPEVPVPTVDLAKFDIAKLDLAQFDISKIDISKFDISKIDIAKLDPTAIDLQAIAVDARQRLATASEDVRRGVSSTVTMIREAVRL
jgi:hypothetical protein